MIKLCTVTVGTNLTFLDALTLSCALYCCWYRSLLAKLPKIPILLVAMATEGSRGSQLLEEGRGLAEQWKASFVSSSEPSWSSELLTVLWKSHFIYTCTELGKFSILQYNGPQCSSVPPCHTHLPFLLFMLLSLSLHWPYPSLFSPPFWFPYCPTLTLFSFSLYPSPPLSSPPLPLLSSPLLPFPPLSSPLLVEQISEFFSKCWFSRFSSWNAQDVPEEVKQRLRRRKPLALPDRCVLGES